MSIDHEAYCYDGEASSDRDFLRVERSVLKYLEDLPLPHRLRGEDHVDLRMSKETRTRYPNNIEPPATEVKNIVTRSLSDSKLSAGEHDGKDHNICSIVKKDEPCELWDLHEGHTRCSVEKKSLSDVYCPDSNGC